MSVAQSHIVIGKLSIACKKLSYDEKCQLYDLIYSFSTNSQDRVSFKTNLQGFLLNHLQVNQLISTLALIIESTDHHHYVRGKHIMYYKTSCWCVQTQVYSVVVVDY